MSSRVRGVFRHRVLRRWLVLSGVMLIASGCTTRTRLSPISETVVSDVTSAPVYAVESTCQIDIGTNRPTILVKLHPTAYTNRTVVVNVKSEEGYYYKLGGYQQENRIREINDIETRISKTEVSAEFLDKHFVLVIRNESLEGTLDINNAAVIAIPDTLLHIHSNILVGTIHMMDTRYPTVTEQLDWRRLYAVD